MTKKKKTARSRRYVSTLKVIKGPDRTMQNTVTMIPRKDGSVDWTIRVQNGTISTSTSSSSVSIIKELGVQLLPALTSLAKK